MKKEFTRVRSIKDIIIFTSLVIIGGILLAMPTGIGLNIAGFFLIFAGIILGFVLRTEYKDMDTGDKYCKKEHFFQQAMNASISSAIASRPNSIDMSEEDKGNALRLDVYYSKTTGKAYLQLFEYIPYKYESCSRVFEHELNNVSDLIK